jgi:hypothetical protein
VSSDSCRLRLPPSIRQGRTCARASTAPSKQRPAGGTTSVSSDSRRPRLLSRKSTALTTKPPGGGEEAHRRWPEGRSEWGASKAKQRPPGGTTSVSSDSCGEAAPIPPSAFLNSPNSVLTCAVPSAAPYGPTCGWSISTCPQLAILSKPLGRPQKRTITH